MTSHRTASRRIPWRSSIRARLLSLVIVPVLTGLLGAGAFLVAACDQERAEDAVRRALTMRTATQDASQLLDDVDNAQWSGLFGDAIPIPNDGPTLKQALAAWDDGLANLRRLSMNEPGNIVLLDRLEAEVEARNAVNSTLADSLIAGGKLDLSAFGADPSIWLAYEAPERTLVELESLSETALARETASAEQGRRRMQTAVPVVVGFGLLASLFLAIYAGRKLGRRIGDVERNALNLAEGRPLEPVARGKDEVACLARALEEASILLATREGDLRVAKEAAEAANVAKSEFLSRMSHELRTPLNSVLGFGQLLGMNDELASDDRDAVEKILTAGRHLLSLIDDVLDVSRIEAGAVELSLEAVDLGSTVRSALDLVRPFAAERPVRIQWDEEAFRGRYVLADARRFNQVLLNLLSNGVKYNVVDGTLTVGIDRFDGRVLVRVIDSGLGIGPEQIERLFTPFERLGAERAGIEGTGLGLALSKRLVEAMGGTIRVDSIAGAGSTFTIDLPETQAPGSNTEIETEDEADVVTSAPHADGATVLYIEDNLANLKLVERIMRRRPGLRLLSAMQGRLGLELARQHRPDLILLDLHLPDIPGEEVLWRLRMDARTAEVPVIAISADATAGRIERLIESGVSAYLTKPFDVEAFLRALDEALVSTISGDEDLDDREDASAAV